MSSPISATAPAPTPWWTGSDTSSSSSPEPGVASARVGRDGALRLVFERRGPRTVLTERRFTLPLQALACMELDDSGTAALMLLNPTGGIVGGDVLDTSVSLGPGSSVCLSTPSATRVYRTAGPVAVQRFRADVGDGARLEYLPGHLIPSPGARLRQWTEVVLARDASLLLADAWAVGRVARGERWRFHELDMTLIVADQDGPLLRERARLGSSALDGLTAAEGFSYVGTFVVIAPRADWDTLSHELHASMEALGGDMRAGVTTLARRGMLVRLLCGSAPTLETALQAAWAQCRRRLFDLAPLPLRKI